MLFCGFLSGPGLNQVTSTFWSVTQSLHGGEQATIPHMEEDSQSFHMIPNAQIFISEITLIRANYTFICVAPRNQRGVWMDRMLRHTRQRQRCHTRYMRDAWLRRGILKIFRVCYQECLF